MLPQLRKLERKYADELVVIGVHSAKFMAEKATENLREAILRYDIAHPVINDADFLVWRTYGVNAWPTFFFINPQGNVIGKHAGELPPEPIDRILAEMVREYDALGLIDRRPLAFRREELPDSPLLYPGKVAADEAGERLVIADTSHHRLVVAGLDGTVRLIVGSREQGFSDGSRATAAFNPPQGIAIAPDGETLYVADTENHAIRRVDLAAGTVETLAGTGEQARGYLMRGPGRGVQLNSPWDLALVGDTLYIAMAGFHQVWTLDLASADYDVAPFAGNAREDIVDGPLDQAEMAQPSGITHDGERLYVADSETSAIRAIDPDQGWVATLVGVGLFDFGDVDSVGDEVRLQHPLGVCAHEGVVYVADTYNHKIKRLDPRVRAVETVFGSEPGHGDGLAFQARFREPSGLAVADGKLYVADTNNHAIRVADLTTGAVTTLELRGLGETGP